MCVLESLLETLLEMLLEKLETLFETLDIKMISSPNNDRYHLVIMMAIIS